MQETQSRSGNGHAPPGHELRRTSIVERRLTIWAYRKSGVRSMSLAAGVYNNDPKSSVRSAKRFRHTCDASSYTDT